MQATVYFPPARLQRTAWFSSTAPEVIEAYRAGQSRKGPTIEVSDTLTGDHVADALFDLSNNPGRQEDRDKQWGEFRSLSVGDIVECNNKAWICKNVGWEEILIDPMPAHLARADRLLTADELRQKYGRGTMHSSEHPKYLKSDWKHEVDSNDTLRGYWEWVEARLEEEE